MAKWAKVLALTAVAVLLGGMVFYGIYGGGKIEMSMRTSGIVEGIEVNLAPKIAGRISEICCNEGDRVERDQVAVRLESDDLKAAVEQAMAGVEHAEANINVVESSVKYATVSIDTADAAIKTAQADLEKAKAQMDDADQKLARARALYGQKFISQDALGTANTAYAAAAADFSSTRSKIIEAQFRKSAAMAQRVTAEDQLKLAKSDLKQSQAIVAYNKAKFADTLIASPISGTVTFKALQKGETVSPGTTVLTIVDTSSLYARVDVDETWVDKIALGGEATIRAEGSSGKPVKGQVTEIGRYAEFATQRDMTRGRQDIKTFRVKVTAQGSDGQLKPGMTVEVELTKRPTP